MAITCHIFECNALHYNYVMRKKCPLQITFHYFENVIHYNYITITITITPDQNTVLIRNVHLNKQKTPNKHQMKQDDSGKIVIHEMKSLISVVV